MIKERVKKKKEKRKELNDLSIIEDSSIKLDKEEKEMKEIQTKKEK
jgi:hypothetical protein